MKTNRRRYTGFSAANHKVIAFFSLLILILSFGAFSNLLIRSSIRKIGMDISKLEHEKISLRLDKARAQARWSQCSNPDNLEVALRKHGLNMDLASGERVVSLRGMKASEILMQQENRVAYYEAASRHR